MRHEAHVEQLFDTLISGDREAARAVVRRIGDTMPVEALIGEVFWSTYELIERLHRNDQMTTIAHHLATRFLRVLTDQAALRLVQSPRNGRRVFAVCGPNDPDELGAQMSVDLLESAGFTVAFAGGGIASDEILEQVQETRPDVLLFFASAPCDLPGIRGLIDQIHEIGAVKGIQIVVGGGVFNRAQGLAEEIGADLWASTPPELVSAMLQHPERRALTTQQSVGRRKRMRPAA